MIKKAAKKDTFIYVRKVSCKAVNISLLLISSFFTASAATLPATSPNLIAYLIPSRTKGFACPAESPTRMTLS